MEALKLTTKMKEWMNPWKLRHFWRTEVGSFILEIVHLWYYHSSTFIHGRERMGGGRKAIHMSQEGVFQRRFLVVVALSPSPQLRAPTTPSWSLSLSLRRADRRSDGYGAAISAPNWLPVQWHHGHEAQHAAPRRAGTRPHSLFPCRGGRSSLATVWGSREHAADVVCLFLKLSFEKLSRRVIWVRCLWGIWCYEC